MKETLAQKLQTSLPYTKEELHWLLDHIGDSSPQIRDELVYNSFCNAFLNQLVSQQDARWLIQQILKNQFLFQKIGTKGQATLTRSFTALLLALFISLEGQIDSPYYALLTQEERELVFQQAFDYLEKETDTTGWSEAYGWVHAVAHGAELLLHASLHEKFPAKRIAEIWKTILVVLQRQQQIFSAGEERRLALIISQLVLQNKLDQQILNAWVEELDFPDTNPQEYFATVNLENFLAAIYLNLEKEEMFSPLLKATILAKWTGC